MNEKLIKDYCLANNIGYYLKDGGKITIVEVVGEWIMFEECDISGYYVERYKIDTLDVLAWVYSQIDVIKEP